MTPGVRGMSQAEATERLAVTQALHELDADLLSRAPEHDLVPSLDRIAELTGLLGDPQRAFRVVHVTGTNGKTSTVRMIEAMCREYGLKTGRFTSPHLHSFRERIAINGESVDAQTLVETWRELVPLIDLVDERSLAAGGPRMTYFEVLVGLAYAIFADAPVDVAVVEVGMGGSWDATNVADGDVAVVTPVDVDHTRFLGSSPERIAVEKAGIVKRGAVLVSAAQQPEVGDVLQERAELVGARLYSEGPDFAVEEHDLAVGGQLVTIRGLAATYPDLVVPLHGGHQAHNAAVAVAALEAFLGGGERPVDLAVLQAGLAAVTSPGRLEVVRRSPTILVDAAHNPHGAQALRLAVQESFTFTRLIGVLAVLGDKDVAGLLEELEPVFDEVVVTRNTSPRCLAPAELAVVAGDIFGEHRVTAVSSLPQALDEAATLAERDGVGGGVLATGSVVTAADVRMLLGSTQV